MVLFGAANRWGFKKAPLSKICHTYPTMIKLGTVIPYLKKIQKVVYINGGGGADQKAQIKEPNFLIY